MTFVGDALEVVLALLKVLFEGLTAAGLFLKRRFGGSELRCQRLFCIRHSSQLFQLGG